MEAINLENQHQPIEPVEAWLEGLKQYSAFRFFPQLLERVRRQKELQIKNSDTIIVQEGETAEFIFMSLSGGLRRSMRLGHLNDSTYVSDVDAFEFIGFSELLERKKFFMNYQTLEETTLLVLNRIDLHSIFLDDKDLMRFRIINSSKAMRNFIFHLMDQNVQRETILDILDSIESKPRMLDKRAPIKAAVPSLFFIQSGVVAGASLNEANHQNIVFKPGSWFTSIYSQKPEFKTIPLHALESVFYHSLPMLGLEKKLPPDLIDSWTQEPAVAVLPAKVFPHKKGGPSEIMARSISLKKLEHFGFHGDIKDVRFGGLPLSPYHSTIWNFLVLFGEDLNESYINKIEGLSESINLTQFASALENFGFVTNLKRYYLATSEALPNFCLIFFFGRPVIVMGRQAAMIFLLDPVHGFIVVDETSFFKSWSRNLIAVSRAAVLDVLPAADTKVGPEKAEQIGKNLINNFLDKMSDEFKNLLTFQLFQSLVVIAVPSFLYGLVNQSVGKTNIKFIYGYYWGLALFIAFQAVSTFALNIYSAEILSQMKTKAETYFYKLFLHSVASPQMPLRAGAVATKMSLIDFSLQALKYQRVDLLISAGATVLFLLIIGSFSWQASFILLASILTALGIIYFLRKKGGFTEVNTALLRQEAMDSFVDIVQGFRGIQSTQTMKIAENKINSVVHQLAKGSGQYVSGMIGLTQKGVLIFKIGGLLALFIVFKELLGQRSTPAEIFGLTLYLSYLYSPFKGLLTYFTNYNTVGLFGTPGQLALAQSLQKSKTLLTLKLKGAVHFDRVNYRYSERMTFTLNEVSFKIQPGERIAIVGRSGSGKTTLAKLIARHMEPTSGKVLYDDVDSRLIELTAVHSQIGFVPQVPSLFAGTIAYNVCFSDEESMLKKTQQICRSTHAHEFIKNLPGNYNYKIKELGVGLSAGQKQVIALTRVLLSEPEILVMDEATAHLDPEAEAHIIDQVYERKQFRTTVMVVQKMTTACRADRIFVVKQGRIIEEGDHNRLLALGGEYSELYRQQVSDD